MSKTVLLIHGAWHGGFAWHGVARRLRQRGHTVVAPTLLRTFIYFIHSSTERNLVVMIWPFGC